MVIPSSSYWCSTKTLVMLFFFNFILERVIYLFISNPFLSVYPQYISGISALSQQLFSLDLYFFLLSELMDHFVVPIQRWEGNSTIKSFTLSKVLSCFHKGSRAPNDTTTYVCENLLKVAGPCMSHKAAGAAVGKKMNVCPLSAKTTSCWEFLWVWKLLKWLY